MVDQAASVSLVGSLLRLAEVLLEHGCLDIRQQAGLNISVQCLLQHGLVDGAVVCLKGIASCCQQSADLEHSLSQLLLGDPVLLQNMTKCMNDCSPATCADAIRLLGRLLHSSNPNAIQAWLIDHKSGSLLRQAATRDSSSALAAAQLVIQLSTRGIRGAPQFLLSAQPHPSSPGTISPFPQSQTPLNSVLAQPLLHFAVVAIFSNLSATARGCMPYVLAAAVHATQAVAAADSPQAAAAAIGTARDAVAAALAPAAGAIPVGSPSGGLQPPQERRYQQQQQQQPQQEYQQQHQQEYQQQRQRCKGLLSLLVPLHQQLPTLLVQEAEKAWLSCPSDTICLLQYLLVLGVAQLCNLGHPCCDSSTADIAAANSSTTGAAVPEGVTGTEAVRIGLATPEAAAAAVGPELVQVTQLLGVLSAISKTLAAVVFSAVAPVLPLCLLLGPPPAATQQLLELWRQVNRRLGFRGRAEAEQVLTAQLPLVVSLLGGLPGACFQQQQQGRQQQELWEQQQQRDLCGQQRHQQQLEMWEQQQQHEEEEEEVHAKQGEQQQDIAVGGDQQRPLESPVTTIQRTPLQQQHSRQQHQQQNTVLQPSSSSSSSSCPFDNAHCSRSLTVRISSGGSSRGIASYSCGSLPLNCSYVAPLGQMLTVLLERLCAGPAAAVLQKQPALLLELLQPHVPGLIQLIAGVAPFDPAAAAAAAVCPAAAAAGVGAESESRIGIGGVVGGSASGGLVCDQQQQRQQPGREHQVDRFQQQLKELCPSLVLPALWLLHSYAMAVHCHQQQQADGAHMACIWEFLLPVGLEGTRGIVTLVTSEWACCRTKVAAWQLIRQLCSFQHPLSFPSPAAAPADAAAAGGGLVGAAAAITSTSASGVNIRSSVLPAAAVVAQQGEGTELSGVVKHSSCCSTHGHGGPISSAAELVRELLRYLVQLNPAGAPTNPAHRAVLVASLGWLSQVAKGGWAVLLRERYNSVLPRVQVQPGGGSHTSNSRLSLGAGLGLSSCSAGGGEAEQWIRLTVAVVVADSPGVCDGAASAVKLMWELVQADIYRGIRSGSSSSGSSTSSGSSSMGRYTGSSNSSGSCGCSGAANQMHCHSLGSGREALSDTKAAVLTSDPQHPWHMCHYKEGFDQVQHMGNLESTGIQGEPYCSILLKQLREVAGSLSQRKLVRSVSGEELVEALEGCIELLQGLM